MVEPPVRAGRLCLKRNHKNKVLVQLHPPLHVLNLHPTPMTLLPPVLLVLQVSLNLLHHTNQFCVNIVNCGTTLLVPDCLNINSLNCNHPIPTGFAITVVESLIFGRHSHFNVTGETKILSQPFSQRLKQQLLGNPICLSYPVAL